MSTTPLLALPLLAAAQAQKHVTMNEALLLIDALAQIAVKEQGRLTPPDNPSPGDRYVIGATPSGAFADKAGMIASFDGSAWVYTAPRAGFILYVSSENRLYVHDGSMLKNIREFLGAIETLSRLGVGTGSDPNNVLSVKGASALLAALGTSSGGTGDFRLTLNKEGVINTASHMFQTNWSGRAETGLSGDDQYRIKVSSDGSTWLEALGVDNLTGSVRLPSGLSHIGGGSLGFRNCILNPEFSVAQRGVGPFALNGAGPIATFDRWRLFGATGAAASLARTANNLATAGNVSGAFYVTLTGTAVTATARPVLETRLEQLLPLSGKRVTLSFRYRANAAFSIAIVQNFGTGGSAPVAILLSNTVAASTTWKSVSLSAVLPALTGKVLGSSSFLSLQFTLLQASIVDFADVQLEEGYATPFERRPAGLELVACRRFFRRSASALNTADLALEMRVTPVVSGAGPFDYEAEFEGAS